MFKKLKVPNYLLRLQSPILAENTETICGVCHNLAFTELIDSQYELSDMEVLEIARKKIFDFNYSFYDNAVNIGAAGAVKMAQKEVGTLQTGVMDSKTLKKLNA